MFPPPSAAVVAMQNDKDAEGFARELFGACDEVVLTRFQGPRALDLAELAERASGYASQTRLSPSVSEALDCALRRAGSRGIVCVTGSFHTVSEAMEALGVAVE